MKLKPLHHTHTPTPHPNTTTHNRPTISINYSYFSKKAQQIRCIFIGISKGWLLPKYGNDTEQRVPKNYTTHWLISSPLKFSSHFPLLTSWRLKFHAGSCCSRISCPFHYRVTFPFRVLLQRRGSATKPLWDTHLLHMHRCPRALAYLHTKFSGARYPSTGPNSFVFTYIFTKQCPHQRSTPPPKTGPHPPRRNPGSAPALGHLCMGNSHSNLLALGQLGVDLAFPTCSTWVCCPFLHTPPCVVQLIVVITLDKYLSLLWCILRLHVKIHYIRKYVMINFSMALLVQFTDDIVLRIVHNVHFLMQLSPNISKDMPPNVMKLCKYSLNGETMFPNVMILPYFITQN